MSAIRQCKNFIGSILQAVIAKSNKEGKWGKREYKVHSQVFESDLLCIIYHPFVNVFLKRNASLYEGLSIGQSVRWSVGLSVSRTIIPLFKPRFSAVLGHSETQKWFEWSTNVFGEPLLLLCRFIYLFVNFFLQICYMLRTKFNICGDTNWTHRCPVGLVTLIPSPDNKSNCLLLLV